MPVSSAERRSPRAAPTRVNKNLLAPRCMLVLALFGIGDALVVAHANYIGNPLWCHVSDGCNAVVNSPYSRVRRADVVFWVLVHVRDGSASDLRSRRARCAFARSSTPG
jgi:hypothetical protein